MNIPFLSFACHETQVSSVLQMITITDTLQMLSLRQTAVPDNPILWCPLTARTDVDWKAAVQGVLARPFAAANTCLLEISRNNNVPSLLLDNAW